MQFSIFIRTIFTEANGAFLPWSSALPEITWCASVLIKSLDDYDRLPPFQTLTLDYSHCERGVLTRRIHLLQFPRLEQNENLTHMPPEFIIWKAPDIEHLPPSEIRSNLNPPFISTIGMRALKGSAFVTLESTERDPTDASTAKSRKLDPAE